MSQTYFAILTAVGEAKLANAAALGTQLQISRMAVGDGGGSLPNPNRNQTALVGEQYRADLNTLQTDPANASQVIAELVVPETIGGWWIREMGLYDAAGDLIAISNCPPSYKPQMAEGSGRTQVLRMVLIVSSTAAVQLKIDPSVVLATREFVVTTVAAELAKLDNKQSVRVATTAAVALTGLPTIDGIALAAGDRVLVKNQGTASQNGIYVAAVGAWSRASDADASIEVTPGMLVPVEQGSINADSIWQLVTDFPLTLGSTALTFEIAAGPTGLAAGTYRSVTVDKRGRVIGGTNPTTLAGYGITDGQPLSQYLTDYVSNKGFGIGRETYASAEYVTDANVLTKTGFYAVGAAWNGSPYEGTHGNNQGLLIHYSCFQNTTYAVQTFRRMQGNEEWIRHKLNGNWSAWVSAFHTGNVTTVAKLLLAAADEAVARQAIGAAPLDTPAFTGSPTAPTPTPGNSSTRLATSSFVQSAIGPGQVAFFARATAPAGWLKANGAAISRTAYAELFAAIGTTFGAGDGSTTFNLPDLRGEFLRAVDDSRGVDAGRTLGSYQKGTGIAYDDANAVGVANLRATTSAYDNAASFGADPALLTDYPGTAMAAAGASTSTTHTIGMTRPRNIALLACIKY